METGLAKKIISELGSKDISEKITFHVMGEPTMHPDFFEILEHAEKENVKVGLTTNGSKLGGKIGRRLADYNLYQIDISLQTPDRQSFTLRKAGSLSFDDYVNGILDFFASYHMKHNQTIFKFRFLNTRFPPKGIENKKGPIRVISSTKELCDTFNRWAGSIYDIIGIEPEKKEYAAKKINRLVSYKWNVVEVYPNVFFETYVLNEWGHAFDDHNIRDALAGYCFGMRDHFAILYNGDLTLCCIDFEGHTAMGNLNNSSLEEILSSDRLGKIIKGFKIFRLVHPYCKKCLGSKTLASQLFKPIASVVGLKLLKPFFYSRTSIFKD